MRFFPAIVMCWFALVSTMGANFSDDFSQAPAAWRTHNPGAVQWDSQAKNLSVTWDSRQTNSFFYYPLGTTLTRSDSFDFEFTLRLDDLMLGIDPAKKATFEVALGFINLQQALRTNFFRGSGRSTNGPRSIVEFAYFEDDGFGKTIGPIIASRTNQIAFSHTFPVALEFGETYRIKLSFDSASQTLLTTILHNGQPYGAEPDNSILPLTYPSEYADFRIDAFSIHSYSDAGQSGPFPGSLLAHGTIDDVVLHWPDPPIVKLSGNRENGAWIVHFDPASGWFYSLQRSLDLKSWDEVSNGNGPELQDANPPLAAAYYRVLATRP